MANRQVLTRLSQPKSDGQPFGALYFLRNEAMSFDEAALDQMRDFIIIALSRLTSAIYPEDLEDTVVS